jgi:hypothetical protein
MNPRAITAAPILVIALAACATGGGRPAEAGPATYDSRTRSFHFRYTFAAVPVGDFGADIVKDAPAQTPTPEQDRVIRSLLADGAEILFAITDQRAKVGQFDHVDSVEEADLVVSLTGRPSAPSWSARGKIEGRPGHCVVFFGPLMDLMESNRQDAVAVIAHDLFGHYVFNLVDEYDPAKFPKGCPVAPSGPGCLMDNFLSTGSGRGWSGWLCDDGNHNVQPAQTKSCQALVDEFFAARGNPAKVVDREAGEFRDVRRAARQQAMEFAQRQIHGKTTLAVDPAMLRDESRKILQRLLDEKKLSRRTEEVERAVREIAGAAAGGVRLELRGRIDNRLDERLRTKAAELAARYPPGGHPRSTRLALIRKELHILAIEELFSTLHPQECQRIEEIVREAVPVARVNGF